MADNRYEKNGKVAMELLKINSGTYLAHKEGKYTLCIGKNNKVADLKLPKHCTICGSNCGAETLAVIKYDFAGISFDIPVVI